MYAALTLFAFVCLTATATTDHHQPCHPPNMTGFMNMMSLNGDLKANGAFTYDSMGKKLRFRSNESHPANTSVDVLMLYDEGVFYEIDSKNQSCQKKLLHCSMHPMDIPDDAKFVVSLNLGSPTIEGEGIKVNVWTGSLSGMKGHYTMSVTMGCVPLSSVYFSESTTYVFNHMDVELEIKDPEQLVVPSFCMGQPLEETPEGTLNSFINELL